ncbi:hypothetical protein DPMN_024469 [Dreissena polymorpha]|uniref:Uncharacterized protein n=1 Tax=Dreissena polymorpha TaxID=45954 RepID=A0A9D4LPS5_DREPO|nr:hypothetical protein DPMN_024469 [Dreissena polymorpha]
MTATLVGPKEPLLAAVKRQKLAWFGHVTRHDSLCKTVSRVRYRDSTSRPSEEKLDVYLKK